MAIPTIFVHIFIHGTILAGYFFLNPYAAWTDSYDDNCPAFQSARAARLTMSPSYAELIKPLGMQNLTEQVIHEQRHVDPCAALYILTSFHQVFKYQLKTHDSVQYYTFGWSGLLSERERVTQAKLLYQNLYDLQKKLLTQYPDHAIAIRLYGHSHGGQLIAHLAAIDQELRTQGEPALLMPLETAFLCATPLVPTSIQMLILSSLFRLIINVTSRADNVQDLDIVSTPGHFCTQRIDQLNVPLPSGKLGGSTYIDLEVTIENSPHAVNHSSFFSCTNYRLPGYLRRLRAIKKTIDLFRPLPILVWYPAMHNLIATQLTEPGYHCARADIYRQESHAIAISLTSHAAMYAIDQPHRMVVSPRYTCPDQITQVRQHFIKRASTAGWNHLKRLVRFLWLWGESADGG